MKKRIIILASGVALTGSALGLGVNSIANAQSTATGTTSMRMTAEHKKADRDDRRIRLEARLNQAVHDGTITAAQKTALLNELKTLRTQAKNDLGAKPTTTQKQAEHSKIKSQLEAWATSNNFPLSKIFPKLAG